ncbi:hypothetical protein AB1N83_008680 [Pleurotus pulmonarius]
MAQPPEFVQPLGNIVNYQKASSYARKLHSSVVLSEPDRVNATVLATAEVTAIKIAGLIPVDGIPNNDQANMQGVLDSIAELRTTITNMNAQMNAQMTNMNAQINAQMTNMNARIANIDARVTDIDTRVTNLDARIANIDARVTDIDTRVTNLDARIDTIGDTLAVIKGLCNKNQVMAIQALNATRSNGMNYEYDEVPFPDGEMPTSVEIPVRGQAKFPHIQSVADLGWRRGSAAMGIGKMRRHSRKAPGYCNAEGCLISSLISFTWALS